MIIVVKVDDNIRSISHGAGHAHLIITALITCHFKDSGKQDAVAGDNSSVCIVDIRLGFAARMLVDSPKNISEICYECGFNNLSNFNRIFKARRNCTPREFRDMYKKNKVLV